MKPVSLKRVQASGLSDTTITGEQPSSSQARRRRRRSWDEEEGEERVQHDGSFNCTSASSRGERGQMNQREADPPASVNRCVM